MRKLKLIFRIVMVAGTGASALAFIFQGEAWALVSMMLGVGMILRECDEEWN